MRSFKQLCSMLFLCLTLVSCTDEDPLVDQETDPRDKFIGAWNVREETAGQVTGNHSSVVTNDPSNTSQIVINNIYNLGASEKITALVAGNSLQITQVIITGIDISGSGTFGDSGFIINLTVNEGDGPKQVKTTYSK